MVYIVYLGHNQFRNPIVTSNSHIQLLSNVFASEEEAKKSMLYSYKHSFSGFSAKLNSTQAATIANMKGVLSIFRSKTLDLHTTRSWDFLGLILERTSAATPLQLSYGDNVIVGIFDSGIWPESESFKEKICLGPIPPSWKGKCVKGEEFDPKKACNRKLIGARYYYKGFEEEYGPLNKTEEYRSARDFLGHGTHVASTAVGSIVLNASFFGFGQGNARGGAPRARLAVYKTCWNKKLDENGKCEEADILAAFDDALKDGVNIISASFGSLPPDLVQFFESSVDIGSFHAMQAGVPVVFSAGNGGPDPSLIGNVSPWSICVAASTIDRSFPTQIVLDTNLTVMGEGLLTKEIKGKLASASMYFDDGVCAMEAWNNIKAKGKIVICFANVGPISLSVIAQEAVKKAEGLGLIFVDSPTKQNVDVDIIPTVLVDTTQGSTILNFLSQFVFLPVIKILPSRSVVGKSVAPAVASFSSRGPSPLSPDFLKPDLTAPGVNILAAWSPKIPPSLVPDADNRSVDWNFQSGTSMSCPHVSGVAALVKSLHPDWSPAAIKSALMTTAGGSMELSDPFDIGAGHINPLKAIDPGLVYDMKSKDYIPFLCNLGYTKQQIQILVGTDTIDCSSSLIADINYPSITVSNLQSTTTVRRTVRNVGPNRIAIYFAKIVEPNGVEVVIWPRILLFTYFRKELSYYVTLKPLKKSQGRYDFGEIEWSDGFHCVRSQLVVLVNTAMDDGSAHHHHLLSSV
ncbi:hypothetical protein JCGZ_16192 [Jatropha curcas]|uniref:Uncharacterized protein n=1 Tax=Jatropha curcas TaxID=180498 RepID=A0A067K3B0_JATCU|nr:hypothetical protein JCGZ_16192 [Jatropha curcas]